LHGAGALQMIKGILLQVCNYLSYLFFTHVQESDLIRVDSNSGTGYSYLSLMSIKTGKFKGIRSALEPCSLDYYRYYKPVTLPDL